MKSAFSFRFHRFIRRELALLAMLAPLATDPQQALQLCSLVVPMLASKLSDEQRGDILELVCRLCPLLVDDAVRAERRSVDGCARSSACENRTHHAFSFLFVTQLREFVPALAAQFGQIRAAEARRSLCTLFETLDARLEELRGVGATLSALNAYSASHV